MRSRLIAVDSLVIAPPIAEHQLYWSMTVYTKDLTLSPSGFGAVAALESNQCGIETSPQSARCSSWNTLESNQCGIETNVIHGLRGTPSRLESNQCGIETCMNPETLFLFVALESNQCGIETTGEAGSNADGIVLESNQCGIETQNVVTWRCSGIELESNQCGIETLVFETSTCRVVWLESNQCGIETSWCFAIVRLVSLAWIEPMWNWNFNAIETACRLKPGLNRTNVELKQHSKNSERNHRAVLESNQCGIETRLWKGEMTMMALLESNQCGIETITPSCSSRLTRVAWIEPMWNWNLPF